MSAVCPTVRQVGSLGMLEYITYIHLIAYFYDDSIHGFMAQPAEYQQNFRSHLTGVLDKSHFSIFNQ